MKHVCLFFTLLFSVCQGNAQSASKKWSFSVFGQITDTKYDKNARQNAFGMGAGIKIYRQLGQKTGLFTEGTSSVFGGTKELRIINGQPLIPKDGLESIHAGIQYRIYKPIQMATSIGPSFSSGNTDWGFRQTVLLSLSKKENFQFRLSFDHVFQDDYLINSDFGSIGYSILVRLF